MKLRIRDHSIRLRLTRSEVAQIEKLEPVQAQTAFGPSQILFYSLEPSRDESQIKAEFISDRIRVLLPASTAVEWAKGKEISLLESQPVESGLDLRILIEKDFFCLKPRHHEVEDESDLYQNPNHSTGSCGAV